VSDNYIDNDSVSWRPSASIETLHIRADLLKKIRLFFQERKVLEVETPYLSAAATTDPYIDSFVISGHTDSLPDSTSTDITSTDSTVARNFHYLHTSPEMPMKRLLAAGSGSIYQLCKVFRRGEQGHFHNAEFTMLEWYRPGMAYKQLMDELGQLVLSVLPENLNINLIEYITYRDAFISQVQVDPFTASTEELIKCAANAGLGSVVGLSPNDHDDWLSLLLTHCIEPHLGENKLTFIFDFPASQASLSCIRADNPPVAERFELYINSVELANGFQELTNSDIQRTRFQQDLQIRRNKSLTQVPVDNQMLNALAHGIPECSGVALGVDRLLMIMCGATSIEQVLSFAFEQA